MSSSNVYTLDQVALEKRVAQHPIHPILLARRSLRVMAGTPIDPAVLQSLFEAARWSPSHYNCQNWRFIYATRSSANWNPFLDSLWDRNRAWAQGAGALIVVLSKRNMTINGKVEPVESHSFEAGMACMAMSLEGTARGLVVHAMGGYTAEKVAQAIKLDNREDYQIEAVMAIGNPKQIPDRPEGTTQRHEIDKFVNENVFVEKL